MKLVDSSFSILFAIITFLLAPHCLAANNPAISIAMSVEGQNAIVIGQSATLTATLAWPNSTPLASGTFTWSASPAGLVSIANPVQTGDSVGSVNVTALAVGTVTIKVKWVASAGNYSSPEATKSLACQKVVTIDGSFSVTEVQKRLLRDVDVYDPAIQDSRPGYEFAVGSSFGVFINCHSTPGGGLMQYARSVNINQAIVHTEQQVLQDGQRDVESGILWVNIQIFAYQLNRFPITSTPRVVPGASVDGWTNQNNVDTSRTGSGSL